MLRRTFVAEDEVEVAAVEQALAMVRELKRLADATLAAVEKTAVDRGRRFVRDRLQDVLNAQAHDLEKKGGAAGTAPAAAGGATTAGPSAASSPRPAT